MEKRCVNYVGLACVDGTCPAAWDETRHLKETDCENCFFYRGCVDCALAGTEYCAGEKTENRCHKCTEQKECPAYDTGVIYPCPYFREVL